MKRLEAKVRAFAEERCREAERACDESVGALEREARVLREERENLEGRLRRANETVAAERRRAETAEARCAELTSQRDAAVREKQRATRALSAANVEKRELEWAVGDFRWQQQSPLMASSVAGVGTRGVAAGGVAAAVSADAADIIAGLATRLASGRTVPHRST